MSIQGIVGGLGIGLLPNLLTAGLKMDKYNISINLKCSILNNTY